MRFMPLSKLANLLCAVALLSSPLAAQNPPPYVNQSNETGLPGHGSFMSSDIDNVNLASGGLHVQIGLYSGKMRGDFSNAEGVRYESKFWTMSNQIAYQNNNANAPYFQYFWNVDADNSGWQTFGGLNHFRVDVTAQSYTCQVYDPCTPDPQTGLTCPTPAGEAAVFTSFLLTDGNGTRYKFPNHIAYQRGATPILQCHEFTGLGGSNNLLQGIS